MRLAAVLVAVSALAYACSRDDDLVPLGILALLALTVLTLVTLQLREERAGEASQGYSVRTRSKAGLEPANDNANPGRRAS
jgi:hypothetical protein